MCSKVYQVDEILLKEWLGKTHLYVTSMFLECRGCFIIIYRVGE